MASTRLPHFIQGSLGMTSSPRSADLLAYLSNTKLARSHALVAICNLGILDEPLARGTKFDRNLAELNPRLHQIIDQLERVAVAIGIDVAQRHRAQRLDVEAPEIGRQLLDRRSKQPLGEEIPTRLTRAR